MRGEYENTQKPPNMQVELPPRARRIPNPVDNILQKLGTTSACAENTRAEKIADAEKRNYLRVRGEYELSNARHTLEVELPPRARRIRKNLLGGDGTLGTTSACAENTA